MRKLKRCLYTILTVVIILASASAVFVNTQYVVPILMYHSINYSSEYNSLIVTPETFKQQMQFLKDHNYNVISLDELVNIIKENKKPQLKTVVITFDDGYYDNFLFAFDILDDLKFPATIFVSPKKIGKKDYLGYPEMRLMQKGKISFGSHTMNHTYLPGLSEKKLEFEIGRSKRLLEKRLGRKIQFFCYPIGGFNLRIQELVKQFGYKAACTTNRGFKKTHRNRDIFALKRIKITDRDNPFKFWAKVSGCYSFFKKVKNPY